MSLVGRQALLLVNPAPTTLRESTAILNRLQQFGSISAFLNSRYVPCTSKPAGDTSLTICALFDSSSSLESILQESPLTVSTPVEPDPWEVDPFDIRLLRSRKQFPSKTFTCEVVLDEDHERHFRLSKANKYHGNFEFGRGQKGGIVEALRRQGLRQDLMGVAGVLPRYSDENEAGIGRIGHEAEVSANGKSFTKVGLMDMWRKRQQTRTEHTRKDYIGT